MRLLIGLLGALLLMPVVESTAAAAPGGMVRLTQGRGRHVRKRVHKKRHHAKRKKHHRASRHHRQRIKHEL